MTLQPSGTYIRQVLNRFAGLLLAAAVPLAGAQSLDTDVVSAWVQWNGSKSMQVRAITRADHCPVLQVGGVTQDMAVRVLPSDATSRDGKANKRAFPVRVCEAPVPADAALSLAGLPLPAVPKQVNKIVVIGDTGCRMKAAESAFQDCEKADSWPFAGLAKAAAAEHPQLVLHVGDYHYRETGCPPSHPCEGRPWGYGWAAWQADFFEPAEPLLRAAPWVFVRGNHEECARAGQGWMRFFDPDAARADRSCDLTERDVEANHTQPYAIDLGEHWQFIVFDSSFASHANGLDNHRLAWMQDLQKVSELAATVGQHSIFVSHHPLLGFAPSGKGIAFGTPALLDPMRASFGTRLLPPGVVMGLHGHLHLFEALRFVDGPPPELIAGHGGDKLDESFTVHVTDLDGHVDGIRVQSVAHSEHFGYLVMDRTQTGWAITAKYADGKVMANCQLSAEPPDLVCAGQVMSDQRP